MTLTGTNSYVVDCGGGAALVVDPGPAIESHVQSASRRGGTTRGLAVAAIAVTHGHPDHAPAAAPLAAATRAPVYAHPNGSVARDADLPLEGELRLGDTTLRVIDAPGHTFDHAAFYLPRDGALFTGDVIFGEGTSVIAPPGGAMRPYQRTLQRLADEFGGARDLRRPRARRHRSASEDRGVHRRTGRCASGRSSTRCANGPTTIPDLVKHIYGAHRQVLWPAMARQVLAHLIALEDEGAVVSRALARAMTGDETAMLNPRIEEILGPDEAAVVDRGARHRDAARIARRVRSNGPLAMMRARTVALWAVVAVLAVVLAARGGPALPPHPGSSQTSCYVAKVDPTDVKATITFYGWPDNAPPGQQDRASGPARPRRRRRDLLQSDDVCDRAQEQQPDPYGIKIYVPFLKQYFIREDLCTTSGPPTGSGSNGCYRALVRSVDRRQQELEEARGFRVRARLDTQPPSSRHSLAARRDAGAHAGPLYRNQPPPDGTCDGKPLSS